MTDFPPAVLIPLAGLLGLCVGSFLNVVIHRLPKMMEADWQAQCQALRGESTPAPASPFDLCRPASHCPQCRRPLHWRENLPLISYFLILRGKCAGCQRPISLRYPLVELLSGCLSAYAAWHFGPGIPLAASLCLIWALLALAFIDLDTQLLPDSITLPLLWLGLGINLLATFTRLDNAVIGAMAGYLSLWTIYWAFRITTGKEGMGYGDFKLLAALGAWFGWAMLPLIIMLSSLAGAIIGLLTLRTTRQGRNTPIPFGPYLAIAGLTALFWGETLTHTYLRLMY